MQAKEIFEKLQEKFDDSIIELTEEEHFDPFIKVAPEKIKEISMFLRDEEGLKFDYLACLSGMDDKKTIGIVYHLYSIELNHRIVIKVELDRENPVIPTVERVWRTADWHEREAWDLYGVRFEGHHNLIRILNPYDWEGFPLRKDYKEPEEYHGIKVPY